MDSRSSRLTASSAPLEGRTDHAAGRDNRCPQQDAKGNAGRGAAHGGGAEHKQGNGGRRPHPTRCSPPLQNSPYFRTCRGSSLGGQLFRAAQRRPLASAAPASASAASASAAVGFGIGERADGVFDLSDALGHGMQMGRSRSARIARWAPW